MLTADIPIDGFLDRSPEERREESDRLSTILEGAHEDSQTVTVLSRRRQSGSSTSAEHVF